MVMPHPLLPMGLPPASVALAMNQMSQLSSLANMAAASQMETEDSKVRMLTRLMLTRLMQTLRMQTARPGGSLG